MNVFSLNNDVKGAQYVELMNWALDRSDAVMLVYHQYTNATDDNWQKVTPIRSKLSAHRIYTRSTPREWPGTTLIPSPWAPPSLLYIDFYAVTPEIRQYILSVGRLHGWMPPNRPEDIAFFLHGKCWFSTTVHEHIYTICGIHPNTREKLEYLGISFEEYLISDKDIYIEPALLP